MINRARLIEYFAEIRVYSSGGTGLNVLAQKTDDAKDNNNTRRSLNNILALLFSKLIEIIVHMNHRTVSEKI